MTDIRDAEDIVTLSHWDFEVLKACAGRPSEVQAWSTAVGVSVETMREAGLLVGATKPSPSEAGWQMLAGSEELSESWIKLAFNSSTGIMNVTGELRPAMGGVVGDMAALGWQVWAKECREKLGLTPVVGTVQVGGVEPPTPCGCGHSHSQHCQPLVSMDIPHCLMCACKEYYVVGQSEKMAPAVEVSDDPEMVKCQCECGCHFMGRDLQDPDLLYVFVERPL